MNLSPFSLCSILLLIWSLISHHNYFNPLLHSWLLNPIIYRCLAWSRISSLFHPVKSYSDVICLIWAQFNGVQTSFKHGQTVCYFIGTKVLKTDIKTAMWKLQFLWKQGCAQGDGLIHLSPVPHSHPSSKLSVPAPLKVRWFR